MKRIYLLLVFLLMLTPALAFTNDDLRYRQIYFLDDYVTNVIDAHLVLQNDYKDELKDVKVVLDIPELGIVQTMGYFDIEDDESVAARISADIPYWAPSGWYAMRIVVSNDDFRRVKVRYFWLV